MASKKFTFGFSSAGGNGFRIKVIDAPTGEMPSERTITGLRNYVIRMMNFHGRRARALTQRKTWTPYKTGRMMRSIKWVAAKPSETYSDRIQVGKLSVGVPYGRYQEFHNRRKPFFMERAIRYVWPGFLADLRRKDFLEAIMFRRFQVGGVNPRDFSGDIEGEGAGPSALKTSSASPRRKTRKSVSKRQGSKAKRTVKGKTARANKSKLTSKKAKLAKITKRSRASKLKKRPRR